MNFKQRIARSILVLAGAFAVLALAGCGAGTVRQLQEADSQNCQQMGLYPGSRDYADCMSTGSARYASQRGFGDQNDRSGRWNDNRNNKCSARESSPTGACPGCQVSCGQDQHASCEQGRESGGGGVPVTCIQYASCECR